MSNELFGEEHEEEEYMRQHMSEEPPIPDPIDMMTEGELRDLVREQITRASKAESELATLKRSIEDAPRATVNPHETCDITFIYICPSCYTTFKGFVSKNTTRFKCQCGQELIVELPTDSAKEKE